VIVPPGVTWGAAIVAANTLLNKKASTNCANKNLG
jgi:hypothetical protein